MMIFLELILITLVLGPAGGVAFAFTQGLSTLETAVAVTAIHLILVPVWFWFFELLGYTVRYESHLTKRIMNRYGKRSEKLRDIAKNKIREFEQRVGQWGFGAGVVGFTFLFGVSWAALAAFLLDIKKKTMMISVAVGAVASSLFWVLVFTLSTGLVPSPWIIYLIGTIMTFGIIGHKKLHERKLLEEMTKTLKKFGISEKTISFKAKKR
ncbi:MAG: hypothetical protein DRN83_02215 [Hadesarchaea archaeon]|nr:MAG: hypothetical protein DRN83_02215 [Hadesarchaea archaeon]